MYEKEWFILIEGIKEGPYSIADLRNDRRITPDTWVWKPGFANWKPIRKVAELKKIFQDVESESEEKPKKPAPKKLPEDDTLALQNEPPYFWIFIILIVICYALYQFLSFRR